MNDQIINERLQEASTKAIARDRKEIDESKTPEDKRITDSLNLRKSEKRGRRTEIYIWLLLSLIPLSPLIIQAVIASVFFFHEQKFISDGRVTRYQPGINDYLSEVPDAVLFALRNYSGNIIVSIFVAAFPILFFNVFGDTPFQLLREFKTARSRTIIDHENVLRRHEASNVQTSIFEIQPSMDNLRISDPRELLAIYTESTAEITKRIYNRAGVYLIVGVVGVMIAFSGLGFFYTSHQNSTRSMEPLDKLLEMIPSFGILFLSNL